MKFIKQLPQGFQQSIWTIGGTFATSGLAALALIILTRALGPTQFGIFSVGFSLFLLLVRLNDWGMTTVIQKFGSRSSDHSEINSIFSFTTTVRLVSCAVTALIGLIGYQWFAQQLSFNHPAVILTAFLAATAGSFFEQFQTMLQSLHRFTQAAVVNMLQGLLKLGIALGFLFSGSFNITLLLALYSCASIVPFIASKLLFPQWLKLKLTQIKLQEKASILATAKHATVGFITAGVIENVDILFVQKYLDTYDVGLLSGINRVALLFSILGYALSTVLNPRAARYTQDRDKTAFIKKGWLVCSMSLLAFLFLAPFSSLIIQYTIGSDYLAAAPLLVILLGASLLTIAIAPFSAVFYSLDDARYFSYIGIAQLIVILIGNALFVPVYGLEAAVTTRLVSRVVLFVVTVTWLYRVLNKQKREGL